MMKETFLGVCTLLNKHKVEYMVIGGVAVIYHGYTRATADIDFWYRPSLDNFHKIVRALKEYGIDVSELEDLVFDPQTTFIRLPTPGVTTELLPAIAGNLSFKDARERAEIFELDGVTIPVIAYPDLIINKKTTNRLKDQSDVEELTKRKGESGQPK
ncbi:MAG TPA: nucleotidyltransferase [Ohtaekwangia sp.]|nr:nucleotidyltransferase [Ohtaekwangia sp.]